MPKAYSLVRDQPWYRRDAFANGLRAAGFDVIQGRVDRARPGDLLLIWNRYGGNAGLAERFERDGGRVLVAENGYLGYGGVAPKFAVHPAGPKPTDFYCVGLGWHNDDRCWTVGGPERWARLGLNIKSWRVEGDHVLILPNRSFGVPGRIMPPDWARRTAERLQKATRRPVRVRAHPGNDAPSVPLANDLRGAWAAVVWSSSAGVHSLLAGIPTYCEGPFWSMKSAAASGPIDVPETPDRLPAFERLAWGQWECQEIETGAPFAHLLSATGKGTKL